MLPQGAVGNLQGGGGTLMLQPANNGIQRASGGNINTSGRGTPIARSTPARVSASVTNPTVGYSVAGSGGTSSTGTTTDPNAIAYYSDLIGQLQKQYNATRGQEGTGVRNINNAYNQSVNELNQQESTAETGYNTQRAQNGVQRESNIGNINTNAAQAFNSLMGLLGAVGAGVSSAARYGAPQAVAQDASRQRSGANTTYNSNNASIDTAETGTKQQFQNSLKDLLTQKNTNMQQFLSGLLGQEANIEQQIGAAKINRAEYGGKSYSAAEKGAAGETNAVNSIENRLNSIFKQYATPSFKVTPVTAAPANLASYSSDPTVIKAQQTNSTTDSSFLPYLASLNNQPNNVLTGPTAKATAGAAK